MSHDKTVAESAFELSGFLSGLSIHVTTSSSLRVLWPPQEVAAELLNQPSKEQNTNTQYLNVLFSSMVPNLSFSYKSAKSPSLF